MVTLTALWLPILLASVFVFVASAVLHMVLPLHRSDYSALEGESGVLEAMRKAGVRPGDYFFPYCPNPKDMGTPEMTERFTQGPVGVMTVMPSGPPAMGKSLGLWFIYTVIVSFVVAYLTGRVLGPESHYLQVFRVAGTAAFLAYAGSEAHASIWSGRSWSTTLKNMFDGLVYGLLTAGVFGWLWPN